MLILAVDTSCDDTCVAMIEADKRRSKRGLTRIKFNIKSNVISSQVKLHQKYGGIVPGLAKREHQKNLPIVFKKALRQAQGKLLKKTDLGLSDSRRVDLIAVTIGPGLEPCLWQGINFAKKLAEKFEKPIVPVNHLEAHILANWLAPIGENSKLFPAVGLVVSGGHTELFLMKNIGKYKLLGETRDDAAGECLDKVARILGLGYPGGPAIAAEAAKFSISNFKFSIKLPRPMIYQKNYDFSFSGLKTAVLYEFRSKNLKFRKRKKYIQAMCFEVQQAIIDVLISKTIRVAKEYKAKSIMIGGGVSANKELRKQIKKTIKEKLPLSTLYIPPSKFCTDNAAMVGVAGYFGWLSGKQKSAVKIKANANLTL